MSKNNFNLTSEFQQILQFMQNDMHKCIFVTGKAGTGKSTLLKYYVENIAPKEKTVVLAPTGIAAVNVGGQTIHSFFRFPPRILVEDDEDIERLPQKIQNTPPTLQEKKAQLIRATEVIVIDEISMVRADIIDAIDTYLRINMQSYAPFGGKKMIFFGDLFQLAPIIDERKTEHQNLTEYFKKRYSSPYFFEAKVFQKQPIHLIELKTIHRQTDKEFIEILNRIRVGDIQLETSTIRSIKIDDYERILREEFNIVTNDATIPITPNLISALECKDPYIRALNKRYNPNFKVNFHDGSINLLTRNADVDAFNQEGLAKLSGKLFTYKGIIQGEFNKNNLPAPMQLELKVGAQVMFLRNKSASKIMVGIDNEGIEEIIVEHGWQNGTLGTITDLGENSIIVQIKEENSIRNVIVGLEVWENVRYEYDEKEKKITKTILGTYAQYPLKLAYAITIHKSQGMTFQRVNIDVSDAFAEGQVYVALSRARSLSGITLLNPVNPYKIKVNPRVIEFYKRF
jgi:ATP-dependent exoDNAse (exonuclease V) alpha subunit